MGQADLLAEIPAHPRMYGIIEIPSSRRLVESAVGRRYFYLVIYFISIAIIAPIPSWRL